MLLSHRIAKNENFLKYMNVYRDMRADTLKRFRITKEVIAKDLFEVRQAILHSIKFVIPLDNMHMSLPIIMHREMVEDVELAKHMANNSREPVLEITKYGQYAKLPFSSVFLENDSGGYLLRKRFDQDNAWDVRVVNCIEGDGYCVMPMAFTIWPGEALPNGLIRGERLDSPLTRYIPRGPNPEVADILFTCYAFHIAEVLLFLNITNAPLKHYKLSKKEAVDIPQPLRKHYEYHILDLYRQSDSFDKLSAVEYIAGVDFLQSSSRPSRAHMVRGHFKEIKGKLYWWNPFMRNRKNMDTIGVVDKDYQIKTK